uniref:Zinc finger, MYND-type containing 12 n=1 Tax=Oryzias latipes TaxID=8090 RepID=H2LIM8_ORYLA
ANMQSNSSGISQRNEKVCELCQSPACLQCAMWQVTFYCTVFCHCTHAEHQRADWVGIHERISKLFVPIPIVVYFHELFRLELIEICTLVVQSKLFEGKHQEALPAALLCLRYTEDVHGPQSVHQAHAFLLLAEANIGLGNLALAAELLSQAEWVLLETPECRNSLLQRLNRNFGCLHAATGNLEDARFYFANDVNIFFATVEFGVNSTVTAGSLFLVVDVFAKMKKTVMTRSLYQEVARIWYDHLTKLLEIYKKSNSNSAMSSNTFHGSSREQVLGAILEFLQKDISKDLAQIALVTYSLSVLRLPQGELLAGARHDTVTHFLLVSSQDWITSK